MGKGMVATTVVDYYALDVSISSNPQSSSPLKDPSNQVLINDCGRSANPEILESL